MWRNILWVGVAIVLLGGTAGAMYYTWGTPDLTKRFRLGKLDKGRIVQVVNSSGTVQPVKSVQVGAFVSAPVEKVFVDFNSEVKEGDVLALIDQRLFKAGVARDEAILANNKADLQRVTAQLTNARNNEQRAKNLRAAKKTFISDQELDQFTADRAALEAQVELAKAGIQQAEAALTISRQNLAYTEITAPVSGVIIDRKVEEGQTVVASFQSDTLFVVAPDLKKKIHIYAAVDEADIGLIRAAEEANELVQFTVDSYPDDLFEGRIEQIRKSPTTNQGVVTYTVVVAAANEQLKLLPGMTANLSFQIEVRDPAIRLPNAGLRFYPKAADVRPEDQGILDGTILAAEASNNTGGGGVVVRQSAEDLAKASRERGKRHVWVIDGGKLRAVPVIIGINDAKHSELLEGKLKPGDQIVTGIKSALTGGG
ncbi:MAG: efflux RND transporter periplasmic adaptor subunit [Pirellulales bacterium]|nr:efflux RND transporter periplasmic adaptor subunit [Pirellulales bacterium]